ncbi:MAG: fatty acid desaturase [Thermoleophilaceae bacterium]
MDPRRLPNPGEPVPAVAWPTVGLFVLGFVVWGGAVALAVEGILPAPVAVLAGAMSAYMFFTVLHDACHRTTSEHDVVNTWLGRLSAPFVGPPLISYSVFRFIHMQHHRFTNHDVSKDPDAYTTNGAKWTWPLRWATLDISYYVYFFSRLGSRPRKDIVEWAVTSTITVGAIAALIVAGYLGEVLLYFILPTRLNVLFLGFAFDFLPHHGLPLTPEEDRYKTTRNRVGLEWLASPLMLYQNYHLVHHLHPLIPFYRYVRAWRRNEDEYLAHDPPLTTLGGRELTPAEYRQLRGLE